MTGYRGTGTLGIRMHDTFAISGDGIPLGVPHCQWPEDREDFEPVSLGQALLPASRLGGMPNLKNVGPQATRQFGRNAPGAQTIERIEENGKASALHPCPGRKV